MSWTTVPSAGGRLRASVLQSAITEIRPVFAFKTSDEGRTSTTYIADSQLSVAVPGAGTWAGQLLLLYNGPSGGTNGRLKVRFNFPSGTLSLGKVQGRNDTAVTNGNMTDMDIGTLIAISSSPTTDILMPTVGTSSVDITAIVYFVLSANTAGAVSIDTAQIVASGTTTIRARSYLMLEATGQ